MVLNHLPGDTRHVRRFPRKNFLVFPKEGDEHAFLLKAKLCPDQGSLGRVRWIESDLFELLIWADPSLGCLLGGDLSLLLEGGCGEPDAVLHSASLQSLC